MKRMLGLSVCAAMAMPVACGSSDDNFGGSGQSLAFDELPARYTKAFCDAARACWGDALEILTGGESCEERFETTLSEELAGVEGKIESGKIKYDGTRAQACLDAVAAGGCNDGSEPAACTEMLDGTVASGSDCSSNLECKGSDTYCKSSGDCPGRCAPRESAGGPCSANDECEPGLRCDREAGRCFSPARAGDRCEGGTEPNCGEGLFCLGAENDSGQSGNCRTIDEAFSGGEGESCFFGGSPLCAGNLRCIVEGVDTTTGNILTRCGPQASSGAACKIAIPDMCPADEYCAVPRDALDGRCTKRPGAGAACATQGNEPPSICARGLACDGGQCRQRQRLGGSCQGNAGCYSDHCSSGGCVSANGCE
jgi:hypothetical protein